MVTETRWKQWHADDFHRYLDIVFEAFGSARLMIGSDWPVCMLSGDYGPVMQLVIDYVQQFPIEVRTGILGTNCARFYGIDPHRR
jgi:L-fuconolactonase